MSARFAILNPCAKRWTDLSGEGRKRFCDECQTDVHALDQYSVEEFAELKRKSGRVCGFLAAEPLPEPRSRRAILIGAFLTAISPLMAQSGRVRIRVTDVTGAAIPGAEASLLGGDEKPTRTVKADEAGEIVLTDLPIGDSRLSVKHAGFKNLPLTVTVRNGDEVSVNVKLEVSDSRMGGAVEARVTAPPAPVAQPSLPKRRWWQIFR